MSRKASSSALFYKWMVDNVTVRLLKQLPCLSGSQSKRVEFRIQLQGFFSKLVPKLLDSNTKFRITVSQTQLARLTQYQQKTSPSQFSKTYIIVIWGVAGVKVTTSEFNSRADSESKISSTHGSNSQRFRSYEFLKCSK